MKRSRSSSMSKYNDENDGEEEEFIDEKSIVDWMLKEANELDSHFESLDDGEMESATKNIDHTSLLEPPGSEALDFSPMNVSPVARQPSLGPAIDGPCVAPPHFSALESTVPATNGVEEPRSPSKEEISDCKTLRAQRDLFSWYRNLNEFIEFTKENGHGRVPQGCKLGNWVNKNQNEFRDKLNGSKSTYLTDKKIAELKRARFPWADRKDVWDERFLQLKNYKEKHGDCLVPTKYKENPKLGRWVSSWRAKYKKFKQGKATLTSVEIKRIEKLEEFGFRWSAQKAKVEQDEETMEQSAGEESHGTDDFASNENSNNNDDDNNKNDDDEMNIRKFAI